MKLSIALLATAIITVTGGSAGASPSCNCDCPPQHAAYKPMRHAPAHSHRTADAETDQSLAYAQSSYDYRSASRVGEVIQVIRPGEYVAPRRAGWREVPDDVNIHFYGGQAAYGGDEQVGYYAPPPMPESMGVEDTGFNGGVGYGEQGGGGGGYGGQAFLYNNQGGGQAEPSNGGGVNIGGGYGRDYHGNWQGYVPPGQAAKSGN